MTETSAGRTSTQRLTDLSDLVEAVWRRFGIPREIAREVVLGLPSPDDGGRE